MLNQTFASIEMGAAPDCSKMACQPVCQCTESKCTKQMDACLDNSHCASLQGCVAGCSCGDHTCTIGCALKNPLALFQAKELLSCTKANCWSETDTMLNQTFASIEIVAPPAPPDCSK